MRSITLGLSLSRLGCTWLRAAANACWRVAPLPLTVIPGGEVLFHQARPCFLAKASISFWPSSSLSMKPKPSTTPPVDGGDTLFDGSHTVAALAAVPGLWP